MIPLFPLNQSSCCGDSTMSSSFKSSLAMISRLFAIRLIPFGDAAAIEVAEGIFRKPYREEAVSRWIRWVGEKALPHKTINAALGRRPYFTGPVLMNAQNPIAG